MSATRKGMVLHDIKNTSATDATPSGGSRRRGKRSRRKTTEDRERPQSVDTTPDGLNLPLLQRIEMALAKKMADQNTLSNSEDDKASQDPSSCSTPQEGMSVDPTGSPSQIFPVVGEDGGTRTESVSVEFEAECSTSQTPTAHGKSETDLSLNQGFCDITNSVTGTPQAASVVDTSAQLECTERIQDLESTPVAGSRSCPDAKHKEELDRLRDVTRSTLMSPDMVQIAEGFREDSLTKPHPAVTSRDDDNVPSFTSLTDSARASKTRRSDGHRKSRSSDGRRKRDSAGTSHSTLVKCTLTETWSPDLNLDTAPPVSNVRIKRRKSSQCLPQPEVPDMFYTPREYPASPERSTKSSQDEQAESATAPSLCMITDRQSHGRRRKASGTSQSTISPETNPLTHSPEDPELQQSSGEDGNMFTPVCLINDAPRRSGRKRSQVAADTPSPDTGIGSDHDISVTPVTTEQGEGSCQNESDQEACPKEETDSVDTTTELVVGDENQELVKENSEADGVTRQSLCMITDRQSHGRRRKASGTTPSTKSPETNLHTQSPDETPQLHQSSEAESVTAPSLCMITDRQSNGRRRKASGMTPSTTSPETNLLPRSPDETPKLQQLSGEDDDMFTPVCFINDVPRRSGRKRSRTASDTPSPDPVLAGDCEISTAESKQGEGCSPNQSSLKECPEAVSATSDTATEPVVEDKKPEPVKENTPEDVDHLLDDLDFGEMFPSKPTRKRQKGRRQSADFEVMNNKLEDSPNLEDLDLTWADQQVPSRRSKRLRRKSLDLYRVTISKAKEEEHQSPEKPTEVEEDSMEIDEDTSELTVETSPKVYLSCPLEDSVSEEPRRSRRTPKQIVGEPGSSLTEPKPKKGRKKKNEPNVEDIYMNKLWRTQMPKEKSWKTIFEEPKVTKMGQELTGKMRLKRHLNFDDFYATTRLKRRRQKALKLGWKPMTERQDLVAAANLNEKLQRLDSEIVVMESREDSSSSANMDSRPSNSRNEVYHTAVESASDFLAFGQLEDNKTSQGVTPADTEEQTFATPGLRLGSGPSATSSLVKSITHTEL